MNSHIRPLTTIEECRAVSALEREIWGYTDGEDVVPPPILIASIKHGAILLGAYDDAGALAGFAYSVPGLRSGQLIQWSHMLGVVPGARDSGLGARLKLAQREAALQMGIELVEWTFDPLQALNAHFSFAKLGVVVEEYEENLYGASASPLHGASPTDRFVAQWHLSRPHVVRRIEAWGQPVVRDQSIAAAVLVNPAVPAGPMLTPGVADLVSDGRRLLVEIPAAFREIQAQDAGLALAWRLHTRQVFQVLFGRGYRAVDFFLGAASGRGHYLLVKQPDPAAP